MDIGEIDRNFTYWPPTGEEQVKKFEELRAGGRSLALRIEELVPNCPEQTLALRKVEEAIMWANAGIARPPL